MKFAQITFRMLTVLAIASQFNVASFADDGDAASAAAETPSGWSTNFSESLDQAEKSHKLVLADFYTSWCGWCKQLDKTTFADPQFMQYVNEHFIPVKLDAEDKGEGQRTAEKNDVSAYPTGLVFAPNGKVIGRIFGYSAAAQYKAKLVKIAKKGPKYHK